QIWPALEERKILLATENGISEAIRKLAAKNLSDCMKAKIIVTPKKAVLDPQGKTVQNALEHMGYRGIGAVHVGKYLEIELSGTDSAVWRKQIDDACHKILSNPVIEDYRFEIVD
ncbi:MAG TPA: phosphoribosylformylglycinamidine synthase subunit PurS, partial [Verrucomicrobiae bacterium]